MLGLSVLLSSSLISLTSCDLCCENIVSYNVHNSTQSLMTIGYYGHGYPYFKGEDYLINPNGLTEMYYESYYGVQEYECSCLLGLEDSVIEVKFLNEQGIPVYQFENSGSDIKVCVDFTESYLVAIADTMRKLGVPPFKLSHEYVVNSTSRDFSFQICAPDTEFYSYLAAGDSVDIPRRWLMERYGFYEKTRYEFGFADSSMVVLPVKCHYFKSITTRSGGGVRRYELTDKMISQMYSDMVSLRERDPGMFEK